MLGKTHQIIGLATALGTYVACTPGGYSPATLGTVLVSAHFAALLPDIDQPGSAIWRQLPLGRIMGEVTNPFLEHRNLSHSLLGLALVGWGIHTLFAHIPAYWGIDTTLVFITTLAAYASHLVADMLTEQGIPLLFPLQRTFGIPPRPFEGVRIKTGGWFENLLIFPLANLAFFGQIWYYWPLIHAALFK